MSAQERPVILITGASRGLGLEFTRQFLQRGATVWAACRDPANASGVQELAEAFGTACRPLPLDVTNDKEIEQAAVEVGAHSGRLDLLINNAGTFVPGEHGLATVSTAGLLRVLHVNAVAPVSVTRAFLPLLRKACGATVVSLTSGAGLLKRELPAGGGQYGYGASKAAMHKLLQSLAADLRAEGVISVGMAPGFVLTDMTRWAPRTPPLLPEQSVSGMIRVIDALTLEDAGHFLDWEGRHCAWEVE